MIQALTRLVLVAAGLLGGYAVTQVVDWQADLGLDPDYVILLFVILGGLIGFLFGGIIGRELTAGWKRLEAYLAEVSAPDLLLGTIGTVVGMLAGFIAAQPLRLLQPAWLAVLSSVLTYVMGVYLGVAVALTQRRSFRLMFPALGVADDFRIRRMVVLDTSAVIDGRFTELHRLGFLDGDVRVPRFVLAELQTLADSADDARRARGRRGLDLLATLPKEAGVEVLEVDYPEAIGVDEKLMILSSDSKAVIVTVDYNLTKVARVRDLAVLNLNEAAAALKPNFIPGDTMHLLVAKPGKEPGQGVGYLEDGTMVVVSDARSLVGTEADIEVTSVLQTSAGRMIFAAIAGARGEVSPDVGRVG